MPQNPPSDSVSNALRRRNQGRKKGRAPPRNRRSRPRRKRGNSAFVSTTIRAKRIYLWTDMSGTSGKWYKNFTLSELTESFHGSFDEFKIVHIRCNYKPDNAINTVGLYCGVLMDQSGFGKYDLTTEVRWFRTLSSFPGSKIRPRHTPMSFTWYPTEPASRNWYRYQTDNNSVIATCYISNDGQEVKDAPELGGVMELFVTMKARGLFWNADIARHIGPAAQGTSRVSPGVSFEKLNIQDGMSSTTEPP